MSLSVSVYIRDASGEMQFVEGDPDAQAAGFESCRRTLWGSKVVRSLRLKLLPSLAPGGELCVEGADLLQLEREAYRILAYLEKIARHTEHDAEYIYLRTHNILLAVWQAKHLGGGVCIG